jgi:hypothetical protein
MAASLKRVPPEIHTARFISQDMNFFQKHTLFEIFFCFGLFYAKKGLIWRFSKIYSLSDFVTKLILKTKKNLPENTNKEGTYKTAIPMKYSSKFLKRRKVQKKLSFSFCLLFFWGGDEIRSLSMVFCDEIKHPQTVTIFVNKQRMESWTLLDA